MISKGDIFSPKRTESGTVMERIGNNKDRYIISLHDLSQLLCILSLAILGTNYLLYAFFQFAFNRNILRIIAGCCLLISTLLGKRISIKELLLIPVAFYMIVVNGVLSNNIAYIILAAIAIPYYADMVWKQLNVIQLVFVAVVVFSIQTGIVNYHVITVGSRIRNTLGFTNFNAAGVFFFSLLVIWLLQLEEIRLVHIVISAVISYGTYRLTNSRTAFACMIIFELSFLLLNKWNGRKTAVIFDAVLVVFFLSPLLVMLLRAFFPLLDRVVSFRLTRYSTFIAVNDVKTLLFGGCKLEGVDSFYLCLLYNGGIVFYIFTLLMGLTALYRYITNGQCGYAAFIISIAAFGLMESGVMRCELLCMVMFWYLLLRPLKKEERDRKYAQDAV